MRGLVDELWAGLRLFLRPLVLTERDHRLASQVRSLTVDKQLLREELDAAYADLARFRAGRRRPRR